MPDRVPWQGMNRRDADYDLGNGAVAWLTQYAPDRDLNPLRPGEPDSIDPCGLIIGHADGCVSSIWFDLPGVSAVWSGDVWQVHSMEPLHVEPSIQRQGVKNNCDHDHHGHIRGGRWEPCPDNLSPASAALP